MKKQTEVSSEENALSYPAAGRKENVIRRELGGTIFGTGSDWMDVADMRLLHFWYLVRCVALSSERRREGSI